MERVVISVARSRHNQRRRQARLRPLAVMLFTLIVALTGCQSSQGGGGSGDAAVEAKKNGRLALYFGTYTRKDGSKGVYRSELDLRSGKLSPPRLVAETVNPSFIALRPDGKFLYAANEIGKFEDKPTGSVTAFKIKDDGSLEELNRVASSGAGPCHINIDANGKHALVANYGGGSVASLPIAEDGTLGAAVSVIQHKGSSVNPKRQKAPHAHSIDLAPSNTFAVAADLGIDQVLAYRFDQASGKLAFASSTAAEPGAGPRHFAFHPSKPFGYVINELNSTVTAYRYDKATLKLAPLQTVSTKPVGHLGGNSTAEIAVHPNGRFLYGSNRGADNIVIYAIDQSTGQLTLVGHESTQGKTPRSFGIDPSGQYLIAMNQNSDSIVVFAIDSETGELKATGQKFTLGKPVCVRFMSID